MAADNTHPLSMDTSKIFKFAKENPIATILGGLSLLAIILPPRSRKRKSKKYAKSYKRRKKKFAKRLALLPSNPGNPGKKSKKRKTKSGKKIPRSVGMKKAKKSSSRKMPDRFKGAKKGTPLMAEKMNWLRSIR